MPELRAAEPLLLRSNRGIEFSGRTATAAAAELIAIGETTGLDRLVHVLSLLNILAQAPAPETRLLASPWTAPEQDGGSADLVDTVLGYIFANVGREVRMADAAARVGMSESGFSRYFRRATGQTFSDTVRKLRLAHACQLLEHTDDPIATICHKPATRTCRTSTVSSSASSASRPADTVSDNSRLQPARKDRDEEQPLGQQRPDRLPDLPRNERARQHAGV